MKFDLYEYKVSEYFASAIINGDYSGLEDNELKRLEAWLDENQKLSRHFDIGDSLGFTQCEVTGLMSNCVEIVQLVPIGV